MLVFFRERISKPRNLYIPLCQRSATQRQARNPANGCFNSRKLIHLVAKAQIIPTIGKPLTFSSSQSRKCCSSIQNKYLTWTFHLGEPIMTKPDYLYHAAPIESAKQIARHGLEMRSGTATDKYLCMSAKESGATTLRGQATDIIFRVPFAHLDSDVWAEAGAGKAEWRGKQNIAESLLEYRRNFGNDTQKKWKPIAKWPLNT